MDRNSSLHCRSSASVFINRSRMRLTSVHPSPTSPLFAAIASGAPALLRSLSLPLLLHSSPDPSNTISSPMKAVSGPSRMLIRGVAISAQRCLARLNGTCGVPCVFEGPPTRMLSTRRDECTDTRSPIFLRLPAPYHSPARWRGMPPHQHAPTERAVVVVRRVAIRLGFIDNQKEENASYKLWLHSPSLHHPDIVRLTVVAWL